MALPLIPIAIGLAVGFFALSKKKKKEEKKKEPPDTPLDTGKKGGGLSGLGGLLGGVSSTLAGGLAIAYGAGKLGGALTGDKGVGLFELAAGKTGPLSAGTITGELGATYGTGINVGRAVGRELDQLAGGTGTSGTGVIAQAAGGGAGGAAVIFGVSAALSFFVVGTLVYVIGSIVSDLNRLAYGQKGAAADYAKEWQRIVTALTTTLQARGHTEAQAKRVAWAYGDGWMRRKNRLAFGQWMRRGRGLLSLGTTSDGYHAKFGQDRGYFVGEAANDGSGLVREPDEYSLSVDYYLGLELPAGELTTGTADIVTGYTQEWTEDPEQFAGDYGYCAKRKAAGADESDILFRNACYHQVWTPVVETVPTLSDPQRLLYSRMGSVAANIQSYVDWMVNEPHGAFVTDAGHRTAGLAQGRYEGDNPGDAAGALATDVFEPTSAGKVDFHPATILYTDFAVAP